MANPKEQKKPVAPCLNTGLHQVQHCNVAKLAALDGPYCIPATGFHLSPRELQTPAAGPERI